MTSTMITRIRQARAGVLIGAPSVRTWAATALILTSCVCLQPALSQLQQQSISQSANNHQTYSENSHAHKQPKHDKSDLSDANYPRTLADPRGVATGKQVELSDNAVYLLQPPNDELLSKLTYQIGPETTKDFSSTSGPRNSNIYNNNEDALAWPRDLMLELSANVDQPSTTGNSLELADLSSGEQLPSNLQLLTKPSPARPVLDRWSGWHDMSIDPDLAAGDNGPYISVVAPPEVTQRAAPMPASPETSISQNGKQELGHDRAQSAATKGAPKLEKGHRISSAAGQFQIKGVQVTRSATGTKTPPIVIKRKKSSKLALNLISQNNLIKMQHFAPTKSAESAGSKIGYAAGGKWLPPPTATTPAPQPEQQVKQQVQQQQQVHQPQPQAQSKLPQPQPQQQQRRRFRRRKKSKTNAEVRIQQLVASDQRHQLQQLQQSSPQNQVNSLGVSAANLDQSVAVVAAPPQVAVSGRRTAQAPPQMPAGKRPPVIIKRMGGQQSSSESSTTKRRRRRLRTLLPVGLSSWFLGGIRDLDGRHWHLSSDVVSKLAINDVDFHPKRELELTDTPSPHSVDLISESRPALERQGAGIGPEVANRVTANKLVPR